MRPQPNRKTSRDTYLRLWGEVSEWSQRTFGGDEERGPVGPLGHMKKEVDEALEAMRLGRPFQEVLDEFADLQILLRDAARRQRISLDLLLVASLDKMARNRARVYIKPTDPNAISEHVRDQFTTPPLPGME